MRRMSKKRRREFQEAQDQREAFAWDFSRCMACGERHELETHEIARGSHRRAAYRDRCCWLRLCRECHERCGRYSQWPLQRQLALKMVRDPEYYDLARFNQLRSRAPDAITQAEVDVWVATLPRCS